MSPPDAMHHVNKVALDWVTGSLFRKLPAMGVLVHHRRKSAQRCQTPVNVFPGPGGRYVVALTYRPDTERLKNVLAAVGGELLT